MSENSATCANCSPLLPLPCPVLRPPLASANSDTEQRKRKRTSSEQQRGMDNGGGDEVEDGQSILGRDEAKREKGAEEKHKVGTTERREIEDATATEAAEQEKALSGQLEKQRKTAQFARQRDKGETMGQLADQTEGKPCSSAVFRLRRPIERLRHLFTKRPMLLQLLNTAFKLFVKRAFRVRPSVVPNARIPPRRSPRPLGRPASIESTAMAKRRVALRLRRRYFRFVPLPRLPPFQCPKCALLTRRPQTMLNHICAKKPAEFKNVNQTVELGFRSRVRDAMSVMERIPNPQAMQFRTCSEPLRDSDHFSLQQPLKLSDIVLKHLQRLNVVQIVQTQKVPFCQFVPFHSLSRTTEKEQSTRTTPQNQRDAFALTSTGFFCSICARLFPRYADWDAHLPDEEGTAGSCPSDGRHPMPIECPSGEMIPRDGLPINCASSSLLVDESDKSIGQQQSHWRCSACALQQFATRAEFHAHLLKCALANTIF